MLGITAAVGQKRGIRIDKYGRYKNFSLLSWTITMRRYSIYYAYSIIGPTLIVTIAAFFSLFAKENPDKMAVTCTCLLTIIAVQWIASTLIPITHDNPWVMRFCTACEGYVGCLCVCIFFLSYIDEVKDYWTSNYKVKNRFLDERDPEEPVVRREVDVEGKVTVGYKASKRVSDEDVDAKWTKFYGENAGVSIDPGAGAMTTPAQGHVLPTNASLYSKIMFLIFPYEENAEPDDEPMPLWLKVLINCFRPFSVARHYYSVLKGNPTRNSKDVKNYQLAYSYEKGVMAANWLLRLGGLAALIAIFATYFNGLEFHG